MQRPQQLMDGLAFGESPRWHQDRLWFSDLINRQVMTVTLNGHVEAMAQFGDDNPSGIGFLPDGTPIVALMRSRRVVRLDLTGGWSEYSSLNGLPGRRVNDMVVDQSGRAYLDNTQHPASRAPEFAQDTLALIRPDGTAAIAASGLVAPNGIAITAEGDTLIVAETSAHRLRSFPVTDDGLLGPPSVFAETGDAHPDGICLDAEGCVWFGSPYTSEFLRVAPGGKVLARIPTPQRWAVACTLGGPDRRTLFLITAVTVHDELISAGQSAGFIELVEVDTPGVGLP
jgi:sugar lactone lactonase YvrE